MKPRATSSLGTPLVAVFAVAVGTVVVWLVSALVLAGGASAWIATVVALAVSGLAPVAAAGWRSGASVRATLRRVPWAALPWNAGVLAVLVLAVPDPVGVSMRHHGFVLTARTFGPDHQATRVASMLSHHLADVVATPVDPPPIEFATDPDAVIVDVELKGPRGSVAMRYLWDTGASYTTLSREAAAKIGLTIPADAPIVALETAAGPRRAPLVVLPAIVIGGHTVEGIAASICDACVHDRAAGLIGLNAIGAFDSRLGPAQRLRLRPADDGDRTRDIAGFVELGVVGDPVVVNGHAHWRVRVHNRSPRPLAGVQPRVTFTGGMTLLGSAIDAIAAGGTADSLVHGSTGTGAGGHFELALHRARW